MMCVLMEVRDANALARACDLGVAMQLTNIARDVGEDAREGRLYLPTDWLDEAGMDAEEFLADPRMSPKMARLTRRLLVEARRLYGRSEAGISALPLSSRPGIFAARHIYAAIGSEIRRNGHDNINHRARTTTGRKLGLLAMSMAHAGWVTLMPRSPVIYARPLEETAFLVEATAKSRPETGGWSDQVLAALVELETRDRGERLDPEAGAAI